MGTIVKVLLVDDSAPWLNMAKDVLEDSLACAVATATSGGEAVRLLEARSFNLLVTDFQMPGINGHELAKITKSRYPEMKIILISSDGRVAEHPAVDGFAHKTHRPGLEANLVETFRRIMGP